MNELTSGKDHLNMIHSIWNGMSEAEKEQWVAKSKSEPVKDD
jgi:hypothetical protein